MVIHNLICRQKKNTIQKPFNQFGECLGKSVALCNRLLCDGKFQATGVQHVLLFYHMQIVSSFFILKRKCCECYALFTVSFVRLLIEHIKYSMNFEIKLIYIFEPDTCFFFLLKKKHLLYIYCMLNYYFLPLHLSKILSSIKY